jgi:hypothetical protein
MNIMVRLLLILAAMIAFLTTMVVTHAHHRAHGREVVLAMEPVDPRDLLLGYYSIIRTDAHTLDMAELEGAKTGWEVGDRIFVTLEDGDDGAAFPVAVSPRATGERRFPAGPRALGLDADGLGRR